MPKKQPDPPKRGRPEGATKIRQINPRLTEATYQKILAIAKREDRSMAYIVERILREYADSHQEG